MQGAARRHRPVSRLLLQASAVPSGGAATSFALGSARLLVGWQNETNLALLLALFKASRAGRAGARHLCAVLVTRDGRLAPPAARQSRARGLREQQANARSLARSLVATCNSQAAEATIVCQWRPDWRTPKRPLMAIWASSRGELARSAATKRAPPSPPRERERARTIER